MAKVVACPKCQARLQIVAIAQHRRVKCPKCQAVLTFTPRAASATSAAPNSTAVAAAKPPRAATATPSDQRPKSVGPTAGQQLRAKMQASFDAPIARVRKSPAYPIAALLVALVMVLLPMVYLSLIACVGYGVFAHLTGNQGMLEWNVGIRARGLVFIAYAAPAVVGIIAVVFMIKPIFAPPAKEPRTRSLRREAEPVLFDFVDRICDAVGARRPTRVDINAQMNASAHFRRGAWSFLGHDLVLTIGLPLVAGLTLREFAGVVAHEFGHFSQGMGMRLSYVIRRINAWFARVVYQRDEWDEWLEETAAELDFRIGWVLALAQVCVWLSRRVLWCLMVLGHAVSGMLLRQMEYDADRYAARIAGSQAFTAALARIPELAVMYDLAQQQIGAWYGQGVFADNVTELTMAIDERVEVEQRMKLRSALEGERASIFDTHPTQRARIANVQREQSDGVFRVDGPARVLFAHFVESSRGVTWDMYCEALGHGIKPTDLRSVAELIAREEAPSGQLPSAPIDDSPIPLVD